MQALVDEFDVWYNTQRRHQGLTRKDGDGRTYRLTPAQAWEATPVADPPVPPAPSAPPQPVPRQQVPEQFETLTWQNYLQQSLSSERVPAPQSGSRGNMGAPVRRVEDSGYGTRLANSRGYVSFRGVRFLMGHRYRKCEVRVAWDPEFIVFAEMDGTVIVVHEHPPVGTGYVGNGVPRGRPRKTGKFQDNGEVSPKS